MDFRLFLCTKESLSDYIRSGKDEREGKQISKKRAISIINLEPGSMIETIDYYRKRTEIFSLYTRVIQQLPARSWKFHYVYADLSVSGDVHKLNISRSARDSMTKDFNLRSVIALIHKQQ